MAKCKICGKAVVTAHVFHRECWQEEVEKLAQVFCDNYCRWPRECPNQDELEDMQIDENAPEVIKEALDKKELSINKGYDLTRQLQDLPEEQREQAAAEALEYEKAKKELKKQDAEIDRKGKIAALFCKAYEKAVLLTPSEENVRCWTDGTRMTPEEMQDTVKESRELAEVFRTIADIIEQKILPADWRCADAESEENDAQPDGNPA